MRVSLLFVLVSIPFAALADGGGPGVPVPDMASTAALLVGALAGIGVFKAVSKKK